jgi:outer membrane protein assembly factor BamB
MSVMLRRQATTMSLAVATALLLSAGAALAATPPPRGKVIALDKRTGRPAWEATLWSTADAAVPPLVTDELIYAVENGTTLKALDATTGRLRWQAPVASRLPLTLLDKFVVAVTSDAAVAFDRQNGKQAWEFSTRPYPEWKFDANTIPVVTSRRLLLPARDTLIAVDPANGQPLWAYTATEAVQPLRPVVTRGMVYLRTRQDDSPVALKLEDGLPNTGEYALPPEMLRAIARARKAAALPPSHPTSSHGKQPYVAVRAAIAPGGRSLAAAGAKRWRFPAPAGWTIDRIAGESAGQVYALLEAAGGK